MTIERMLPLYEGKMGWQYDHRAANFTGTGDTDIADNRDHRAHTVVLPRYWIRESVVADRLGRRKWGTRSALLGFRRVARNTDERTSIAVLLPFGAVSYGWILSAGPDARDLCLLLAQYNSFVFDYVLRQFLSQPSIPQGTFEQLPALTRGQFSKFDTVLGNTVAWVVERVVGLSTSGDELNGFATELGCAPTAWDEAGRIVPQAELDALMLLLFGLSCEEADYVMDTFPIVRRNDEKQHGEFRTKRLVLERYEALAAAIASDRPYESPLSPPPGVPRTAHEEGDA